MNNAPRTLPLSAIPARLGPFGAALRVGDMPESDKVAPCEQIIAPGYLRTAVQSLADARGTDNLRAVGSLWAKYYHSAVLPAPLAAMTLLRTCVQAPRSKASIAFNQGLPKQLCLNGTDSFDDDSGDPLAPVVLDALVVDHLEPFVNTMSEAISLSPRMLWADIAIRVSHLYHLLMAHAMDDQVRATVKSDRHLLLDEPMWPWLNRANPMAGMVRRAADDAQGNPRMVRGTCCLAFQLPDGKYCGTCPVEACCRARGHAGAADG